MEAKAGARSTIATNSPTDIFSFLIFLVVVGHVTFLLLVWSGWIYAYASAWFSLLSVFIYMTAFINVDKNSPILRRRQSRQTDHSKVLKYILEAMIICTFVSAFLTIVFLPPNPPETYLKSLFIILTGVSLCCLHFVLFDIPNVTEQLELRSALANELSQVPDPKNANLNPKVDADNPVFDDEIPDVEQLEVKIIDDKKEEKQIEKGASQCLIHWREIGIGLLLLMIILPCIYAMRLLRQSRAYLESDIVFSPGLTMRKYNVNSNPDDPSQMANFKCFGDEDALPVVIYWHGLGGQALDFSHGYKLLLEQNVSARVCGYDRQGYAQSEMFGPNPRYSGIFAQEAKVAFDNLGIPDDNLVFVGHSMAGYNMRAFDILYPGRIAYMVMIDTLNPKTDYTCVIGEGVEESLIAFLLRGFDSGLTLLLELFHKVDFFADGLYNLPSGALSEYIFNIMQTSFFYTLLREASNLGTSCNFVVEQESLDFPLTVFVAENGIHQGNLQDGTALANLSKNGRAQIIEGAAHLTIIFDIKFAVIIVEEVLVAINYTATKIGL